MATYQIFKETALPGALQAHSIYLIAPAAQPDYVEMYVTGSSAATVKRMINSADVQALIDTAVDGMAAIEVVSNIAARDALVLTANAQVIVIDASADPTVNSGAATYVYRASNATWFKISEAEGLDMTLNWSAIVGKPAASAAAIDAAVTASHSHGNKTQLDKIGENGAGKLTYNGALPVIDWTSAAW